LKSFRKALTVLNEFIEPFVNDALKHFHDEKNEEEKYVFLHALVESTQDRKVLRDQTTAMLLAVSVSSAEFLSL